MKIQDPRRAVLPGLFFLMWSAVGNAGLLTVSLETSRDEGTVVFLLFDSKSEFGDLRNPAKVDKFPLDGREFYRIENVAPGEYALLVYIDENDNGRIDKNFIGIPTEPLGFSNGYRPKGPPTYRRAAFVLKEGASRHFDLKLSRPLGKRGRLGIGTGVILRSSPYHGSDEGVYRVIPAITYNGKRFQVYGPGIRIGFLGSGRLRLAGIGRYRIGVYDEDDSDSLEGMGDRKDTFVAGLALLAELPGGFNLSANYAHDVLHRAGGGEAGLEIDKSFQVGIFTLSPEVGLSWLSAELADYDFGVPDDRERPDRPTYRLDYAFSARAGIRLFIEITRDWAVIMNASADLLDREVTASPIVGEDYVIRGFGAVNYVF